MSILDKIPHSNQVKTHSISNTTHETTLEKQKNL